jgi:hypothetical protein
MTALLTASAQASTYSDIVLSLGPVAYWRLGETSGNTAVDVTGAHSGAYQNSVTLGATGAIGGDTNTAASFGGGNNDRVQVSPFDVNGSGITILAWINAESFGNDSIVSKGTGAGNNATYWMLGINGDSRIRARVKINGNSRQLMTNISAMSPDTWYFVAMTYDGTTMRVYLDGVEVNSRSWSGTVSTNSSVAVGLGNQPSGAGNRAFDGELDELAVFDKALTPAEIAALYSAAQRTLIGHWQLNEASGTTATDSSTYAENGTVSGGPNWSTRCGGIGTFDFDGSSNYVSIPNAAHLQPTSSMTIAGWVNGDSWGAGSNVDVILRKGEGNPNNYQLAIADGRPTLYLDEGDDQGFRGNTVLSTGQWYHIAATWDGSTVRIYVNGQLDNTPASRTGTIGTDSRPVYIGGRSGTDLFDGMIYDVQFYNYALTPSQIEGLFGMVGHWMLEETSGTTAPDSTSFGNDGTVYGNANWTIACSGTGEFDFDGSTNYISIPDAQELQPTSSMTIAAWVRGDTWSSGSDVDVVFRKGEDNPNNYQLAIADGRATLYLDENDSQGVRGDTVLTPGQWYHVAAVWDGSTVSIYVNGELDSAPVSRTGTIGTDSRPVYIGGRAGTDYFDGTIRDVRFYNRPLCPEEIAVISQFSGLVGEWKLDETSGTIAYDSSGNGNDGVYLGGVLLAASSPVPVDGAVAAVFDGNNDYVSIADSSDFDVTGPITVATWINVSSFTKTWQAIFTKGDSAWRLSRNGNTNTIHFACTGLSQFRVDGSIDVNNGLWHHIAGVYDGSTLMLYVDGQLDASVASSGSISTNNYDVEIGRNAQAGGREFHGAIYDARVYDRALCPDEILQLYGGGGFEGVRIIQWQEIQ